MENSLITLDKATRMLAAIQNIDDAKKVVDLSEAARIYAERVGLGIEAQNHAAEIKLRAQRRGGEILVKMKLDGKRNGGHGERKSELQAVTQNPTLADLGIGRIDAHRWQRVANIPEKKFEQFIHDGKEEEERLSTGGLLRIANNHRRVILKDCNDELDVTAYHGDMVEVLPQLGTFDLVISDPPYNVTDWSWDKIGTPAQFMERTRRWLTMIKAALNDRYHLFWFCSPRFAADIEIVLRELHLCIKSRLVWHRRNMSMGSKATDRFVDSWEMIFHCANKPLNFPSEWSDAWFDVQSFAVPQTNFKDTKIHPTQKPVELIRRLIEFGSMPGDSVLDPFAGSGTTGRASAGRTCTLIELEQEYYQLLVSQFGE